MKKTVLAIALAAASTAALADGVKVSGHVNYVFGDLEEFNGNEDYTVGTAGTSESRFRLTGSHEADNGIEYGFKQEFGLGAAGSSDINKRVNEVYMKGEFGKVSLGQGSEAGDGAVEMDYSGTYVTQQDLSSWKLGGAYEDADNDSNTPETPTAGFGFNTTDPSRTERLRYDSPMLGEIAHIAIDIQDDDDVTAAVYLKGEFWKAALYTESREANDSDEFGGSVAFKFDVFTVALQYATTDETASGADDDLDYMSLVLGYKSGPYSFSIDYKTNENDAETLEKDTTGLNFVYRPVKGVELYAGFRNVNNDVTDADEDGILFGSRVKF